MGEANCVSSEQRSKTTMPGWLTRLAALQLSGHDWFEKPRKIFSQIGRHRDARQGLT